MCMPNQMFVEYRENENLPNSNNMNYAPATYGNPSNVYFSRISKVGTILPTLIRRQPISATTRQQIVPYKPQYSSINILQSKVLTASIAAHLGRIDVTQFTPNFGIMGQDKCRFPPIADFDKNMDITAYGRVTNVEDIIINEPLVTMFYGAQTCPFCPSIIDVQDAACLLAHFHEKHAVLVCSYFTCPGCLQPEIFNVYGYMKHYKKTHALAERLMMVLSETSGHTRAQHAFMLYMYLTMVLMIQGMPNKPDRHHEYISQYGGYTTRDENEMLLNIYDKQQDTVPPTLRDQRRQVTYRDSSRSHDTHDMPPQWVQEFPKMPARQTTSDDARAKIMEKLENITRGNSQMMLHLFERVEQCQQNGGPTASPPREPSPPRSVSYRRDSLDSMELPSSFSARPQDRRN